MVKKPSFAKGSPENDAEDKNPGEETHSETKRVLAFSPIRSVTKSILK